MGSCSFCKRTATKTTQVTLAGGEVSYVICDDCRERLDGLFAWAFSADMDVICPDCGANLGVAKAAALVPRCPKCGSVFAFRLSVETARFIEGKDQDHA